MLRAFLRKLRLPALILVMSALLHYSGSLTDPRAVLSDLKSIPQDSVALAARVLSTRFERTPLRAGDRVDGIIALGGGDNRTVEAIRLAALYPKAKVVISAANERLYDMAREQIRPARRLMIERHARNTHENATLTKKLVEPSPGERWLLVTSTLHMPRAMGSFRAAGFDVEPWPVPDKPTPTSTVFDLVAREVAGLIVYRALGRTDELLPAARTRERAERSPFDAASLETGGTSMRF